jgi:Galactose oxidase, central domain
MSFAVANRRMHRQHPVTPTPSPTPLLPFRPLVLITGGTGTVDAPTGENPAVLNTAEIYDCVTGVFLPINSMTTSRDDDAATMLPGGKILIVGGVDTAFAASIPLAGAAAPWILPSSEVFDGSVGMFLTGPKMTASRDKATATLLTNGRVLIVGGGLSSTELYDPSPNKFVVTGEMAESRYGQTATLLADGEVLIAGGGPKQTELYDPRVGKFQLSAKMRGNRIYHTATLLDNGTVLIAGGGPYARSAAVATTEIYDHGILRNGPRMNQTRAGHTATLLSNGHVLIAGGHDDNTAELYDGRRFILASSMVVSRYSHSATLLPDGRVLLTGGWGAQYKPLASAEIFDPANGRFAPTSNMTQARAGHTATLIWVRWPVNWIRPTPTATATPTPTATNTPTPTPTSTATATPTQTASPSATLSVTAAESSTPGAAASSRPLPSSDRGAVPGTITSPHATASPSATYGSTDNGVSVYHKRRSRHSRATHRKLFPNFYFKGAAILQDLDSATVGFTFYL